MKKKKDESSWIKAFKGLKDPDKMFDLAIWASYVAGSLDSNVPVAESRKVFEKIKKILKS